LLPVVIITSRPNQVFTAPAAGVGALLRKPLYIPKMLRTISRLLRESVEPWLVLVAGKVTQFEYLPALLEAQVRLYGSNGIKAAEDGEWCPVLGHGPESSGAQGGTRDSRRIHATHRR
jgi:hypothetical protein